ncbi:MAG TPA: LLM class flavin-dependent oxidoreductase [Candidatus Limnocylindrales bacterium]|nr:LLM class flavin-dependent oxidoreductase [Candidatus Limnocylindrales bacterium]
MRIGVTLPLDQDDTEDRHAPTFTETLGYGRQAEALGLDSIWVFDHLLFRSAGEPDGAVRESWTTLSALATTVPRVELGALVMCASFRNPGLMAKMAATLDDLSGGRLILGLGSGWHEPEYDAFGFPFDHRVGRFAEDLEITTRLLRKQRFSFDGQWRQMDEVVLVPPPDRAVPVLVAAKGPRMLRLTATWADAWNVAWFSGVDDRLRAQLAALDEACRAVDREPTTVRRTVGLRLDDHEIADSDRLASVFDGLVEVGIDDAIIWSTSKSMSALELIAAGRRRHLGER